MADEPGSSALLHAVCSYVQTSVGRWSFLAPQKKLVIVPGTHWAHPAQHKDHSPARWSSQRQMRGQELQGMDGALSYKTLLTPWQNDLTTTSASHWALNTSLKISWIWGGLLGLWHIKTWVISPSLGTPVVPRTLWVSSGLENWQLLVATPWIFLLLADVFCIVHLCWQSPAHEKCEHSCFQPDLDWKQT